MTATPAIALRGIVKHYGATRALAGIDLTVPAGCIFGFLGPNGAGKTTAIRILLDLIRPDAGTAAVLGFDCQRESIEARQRIGYLPGDLRLYDSMLGGEFLDFIDSFRPARRDPAWRTQLLERLALDPTRRIRALSKGNRQKLGIVQALMHRPEVLILDEPTAGLDPLVQEEVTQLLEEAVADGRTVFFSSHVLSEVEKIAQSVAIIRTGQIVAIEHVAQIKSRSAHIIEVTFEAPPPPGLFTLPGVRVLRADGATVHVQAHDGVDALLKAIATRTVLDLRTQQPSLEDIFLAYYTGDGEPPDREEGQRATA
jgi:ABC-2 type transport system ATP-binding protein